MLFTALLYLLLGLGCIALLGLLMAPLGLASGWWASATWRRDAEAAGAIDRLLASGRGNRYLDDAARQFPEI